MTRKIDKRACRKLAMPELKFNLNEGVLHVESCPYIIRTAVRNIAGQRILMLYIYQRENILAGSIKPRWVVFQGRYDFATLSLRENASATWQCSPFDSLNQVCRFDTKCAFYRQQDEARAARFCKCEHSAISALICLQWSISRRKALERKRKKQRAIIERMKYVPVLPRDLKGFIHREVMPQYIFYDYQRKAPGHAYCTACRHEVRIAAAKHNTSGLCPRCKKEITFKCRGRRGRIFDRETVQVLQKAKNGEMLLRIVKAYRTFTDADTPVYFSVYENARHFISLCSDGHCSTSPYYLASAYKDDLTPWKCGYRDYLRMCKEMQYNVESSFILFPRNLKSAHDHVVEALDVKRTAEQEKAIADSFEEWQRLYQYKGKDLMVIPPHSSKELIDEGTALRHCVGRYVKRVAQRECVILFVRKVAEPDKSLCTVEVRDGQVVQTRGFDNEDPPAKIKAFIERWKRQVLCAADKTAA